MSLKLGLARLFRQAPPDDPTCRYPAWPHNYPRWRSYDWPDWITSSPDHPVWAIDSLHAGYVVDTIYTDLDIHMVALVRATLDEGYGCTVRVLTDDQAARAE